MKANTLLSLMQRARRALSLGVVAAAAGALLLVPAAAQSTGADLGITKTAPDLPYSPGSNVEYTITVESNGPANATLATMIDETPPGMTFLSIQAPAGWLCITPAPGGTGTIQCSTSSFAIGSSVEFVLTLRVGGTLNPDVVVTNTATISSNTPDPFPPNNSSSHSFVVSGFDNDTPGVYDSGSAAFFLRNANSAGAANQVFTFGPGGVTFRPIRGDWNNDGIDTIGIYDQTTGAFFLRNTNSGGSADIVFTFGPPNAGWLPIVGDWNNDGVDTIGLYDPATGTFFLKNANTPGPADIVFSFGPANASFLPLAGDWDGNGTDTAGVYDPATGAFFLRNSNSPGPADIVFTYGPAFSNPLAGDWDGDGVDTIGVVVTSTASWFLRNSNSPGPASVVFTYGAPNQTPIAGDWNGI